MSNHLLAAYIDLENSTSSYSNLYNLRPSQYVKSSILILLGLSGVTAFIFLLIGGLQWITAGGDKDASEKAKKKITQAIVGLAIVFSAYAIVYVLRTLFGVNLLQFTITNLGNS